MLLYVVLIHIAVINLIYLASNYRNFLKQANNNLFIICDWNRRGKYLWHIS